MLLIVVAWSSRERECVREMMRNGRGNMESGQDVGSRVNGCGREGGTRRQAGPEVILFRFEWNEFAIQ